jgi:hypothetical protein
MSDTRNKALRPPLRPSTQPMPEGSGFGKAISVTAPPGEWRDPEIFGDLEARVAAEERQEQEAPTGRLRRQSRGAPRAGLGGKGPGRKRSTRANKAARPESDMFRLGKEIATEAAKRIRAELSELDSSRVPSVTVRCIARVLCKNSIAQRVDNHHGSLHRTPVNSSGASSVSLW